LIGPLRRMPGAHILIFPNMKRPAERLERNLLANGFSAAAITGDVDQRRRLRILGDFKEGTLPILVATDVASRGLHIEGVSHVINYDLPFDAEDYVHRAGRTARAGAAGHAPPARRRGVRGWSRGHRALHRFQAAPRLPRRQHAGARPEPPAAPSPGRRQGPSGTTRAPLPSTRPTVVTRRRAPPEG